MMRAGKLTAGVVMGLCLAFLGFVPTGAQEGPGEVLAAVDRAQAQLEQLLIHLDAPASQQQLYSEASTVLALLLTVEEQLKALLGQRWPEVRSLAESLYFQAGGGVVEEMKGTAQALHSELGRLKETVSAWEKGGASLSIKDYGAYPKERVSIPILLEVVPPGGIGAFDVELGFQPDVGQARSVSFPRGKGSYQVDNEMGRVLLSASGLGLPSDASPEQTLAEVEFTVRGKPKDICLFSFQRIEVYDGSGKKVPSTGSNGSLRVLAPEGWVGDAESEGRSNGIVVLVVATAGIVVAGLLILLGIRLIRTRS